jgi:hypothetical protein
MELQLHRFDFAAPSSSVSCQVSYAGDDVYVVYANGTSLRFLSREAAAVYLNMLLGDSSSFDYDLLLTRTRTPHFGARQATCELWVLQHLLLLLRDARPSY